MPKSRHFETLIMPGLALAAAFACSFVVTTLAQDAQDGAVGNNSAQEARGDDHVTSTEMLGDLLRMIEDGTVTDLVDVSALIRSGDLLAVTPAEDESFVEVVAGLPAPGTPPTRDLDLPNRRPLPHTLSHRSVAHRTLPNRRVLPNRPASNPFR